MQDKNVTISVWVPIVCEVLLLIKCKFSYTNYSDPVSSTA